MEYNFSEIEKKWQKYWEEQQTFKVEIDKNRPKFYVLDMFPYPSGAGLHVGHPLGYIASDIYSRYKRLKGFNVLHPMGYDAFGLPAEQYAIQTGQHPAITTENNIKRYREQMDKIGFSYDWNREVRTCDPAYYKWTQWVFLKMFHSYYCCDAQQARPIAELIEVFAQQGNKDLKIACSEELCFTAEEWNTKSEKEQQDILMNYRIAYLGETSVNWCPALGTVLANDEVKDGLSERGGHPVEQKMMKQWQLRVSAYAERLLTGLDKLDWTDSLKDMQKNWVGRSEGAMIDFYLTPNPSPKERGTTPYGYATTDKLNWHNNIKNAKEMRKEPTEAENILWEHLRNRKVNDLKFRRQHLIDQFIVDFVCLEKSLVVEVDGEYHDDEYQKEHDESRTTILNELGFEVVRFTNNEVLNDIDSVLSKIKEIAEKCSTAVNSPLLWRGVRGEVLSVFTTRADTIFGVTFMVLAPESELVEKLTTEEQRDEVNNYLAATKKRTERERIADRRVTGVFSGSYATNPLTTETIPIWISDYVLAGYGTGAIMAVPAHDSRDYAFAKHFDLPIIPLIEGCDVSEESFDAKEGTMINSGFLNGLSVKEAIAKTKQYIEENELGKMKINYRLRDAIFSRQRYWGEPFPIYYKDGIATPIPFEELPLELPEVDKFLPTETGEPPLGRAKNWEYNGFPIEKSTMPGFAGSSAYYLRYMDSKNNEGLVSKEADDYWRDVDLYIGGTEHATGHLIYSRFWNKFLFDLGVVCEDEPFKKLINQGMIQGRSNFVYRVLLYNNDRDFYDDTNSITTRYFLSYGKIKQTLDDFDFLEFVRKEYNANSRNYRVQQLHVDVNIVNNDILDLDKFRNWLPDYKNAEFILEDGKYICGWSVEKMSKSMYNVVNPDMICENYGADTLRMYEMFLGPLEQSKPWDTNGIDGVHRFLKKFWRLFFANENFSVSDETATPQELKVLHKLIKKIETDIENFSFNTSVSAFMIAVNELGELKCNKRAILQPMTILLCSFAPHISEELWKQLGNSESISKANFPIYEEKYTIENSFNYPVSFNGKTRFTLELPIDMDVKTIEATVLANENTQKWLEGKTPKKIIIVPKKIVNVVI